MVSRSATATKVAVFGFVAFLLLMVMESWTSSQPSPPWVAKGAQPSIGKEHQLFIPGAEQVKFSPISQIVLADKHEDHREAGEPVQPSHRVMLRKDIDYFADYDVDSVVFNPGDTLTGKRLFSYVDPEKSKYTLRYVSNKPHVFVVPDFLTDAECDAIVAAATPKFVRSLVVPYGDKKNNTDDVRTSSQTWLNIHEPPAKPIVDRILDFMGFPIQFSEMLQVLRYDVGQKYDAHHDYFDPAIYREKRTTNRAATVFLYLNDCEEGGETQFPRADGKGPTWDFKSCSHGLRVRPKKRMIAVFYDMTPDGQLDPTSLHGGCPVKAGVKLGGTLWLHQPTP